MQELFIQTFPALVDRIGKRNLGTLLADASLETVPEGHVIIQDRSKTERLYLVAQGVCRISMESAGRSLLLGKLGQGQWLGEISLLTGETATSSVTAESEVRLVAWTHETIHRMRESSPEVAGAIVRELIDALSERVRASDAELQVREGGLSLKGSDVVRARVETPRRSWLRRVLGKLSGASEPEAETPSSTSPGKEGGA